MSDQRDKESREQARAQFRTAGLWGIMNSLKREGDSQRAAMAELSGGSVKDVPGYGAEIPFGNTYVSNSSTGSPVGIFTKAAVLALVAGALGFGAHYLLKDTPQPEAPLPINAEIEWEITPDGQTSTGTSGVFVEERRVLNETSRGSG